MPRWLKRGALFAVVWVAVMIALAFAGASLLPDGPNRDQRVDAFANLVGKFAGAGMVMFPLLFWMKDRKVRPTSLGITRE